MNAVEQLNADDLTGALSAAKQTVRSQPNDHDARGLLAQLFCFDLDWQRADQQFDLLGQQNSEMLVGTKLLRQFVRGELARQQFHQSGRIPELVGEPDERTTAVLAALISLREGNYREAREQLEIVHRFAETLCGTANGTEFVGGRDLDDVVCTYFEVLTSNGKFYWVPMNKVINLEFRGYERLQDRIWRSASILVEGFDTEGEVYFPVAYWCDPEVWASRADDQVKLGRKTDWYTVHDEAPVRGMGQKSFLFGDQEFSIMELESFQSSTVEA